MTPSPDNAPTVDPTTAGAASSGKRIYTVGTLRYTAWGLVMLFVWLLWGDLVWTLMERVMPKILQLKLGRMGAPGLVPLYNTIIPSVLVFVMNPIISFRSDRYRSRLGRRIPYLLWTTPILSVGLILFGLSDIMGRALNDPLSHFLHTTLDSNTTTLVLMGLCLIMYRFGETYANTVYWYLFNDVVPHDKLAQFNSWFRVVGTLTAIFYSKYIFPIAVDSIKSFPQVGAATQPAATTAPTATLLMEATQPAAGTLAQATTLPHAAALPTTNYLPYIFLGIGLLYLFGFMLMCLMVKEGQYPPPPEYLGKRKGFLAAVKTYAKECFTNKFYWYFFLMNTFLSVSFLGGSNYDALRSSDSLGLSGEQMGNLDSIMLIATLVMLVPLGWLADKFNPLRVFAIVGIILVLNPILQCIFIFRDFGPARNYWFLLVMGLVVLPFDALQDTITQPMYMRLLPKERYGQFCSANGALRALARIVMSLLLGLMISFASARLGENMAYRLYPLWGVAFQVPTLIFLFLLYREWKRMGGNKGYVPPSV